MTVQPERLKFRSMKDTDIVVRMVKNWFPVSFFILFGNGKESSGQFGRGDDCDVQIVAR